MSEFPKKILVVRFSSIGDIVLTSPIIRELSKLGHEVHFVTKAQFEEIHAYNPHIKKQWLIKERVSEIIQLLKKESFDLVIDLHKNTRSRQLRRRLQVKSIDFDKLNIDKWLMVNFKWNRLPDKHLIDRYFEALDQHVSSNADRSTEFHLNPNNRTLEIKNYVCISFGAAHETKSIPYEILKPICEGINGKVILIGGKKESKVGDQLEHEFDHVDSYCGKLSIHESAQLIKGSNLVITADTGMMHIADSMEKPLIVLWGSTIPVFGMFPYRMRQSEDYYPAIVPGLSCQPCSKLGYEKCPKSHFSCMKDQNVEEIIRRANEYTKSE